MKKILFLIVVIFASACAEKTQKQLTAQDIIDKSIEVSGGRLHDSRQVSFFFRAGKYISEPQQGKKILKRVMLADSTEVMDVKTHNSFKRYLNDSLVSVADTMATKYSNSINSVHYFARLPYGLNDMAVKKELLEETRIKNKDYFKIKITFAQENGGEDFDDTYIYWFNKETFKPDYLAYKFHVNGGGIRFREAFNERYIEGIRFVDYNNLKPKNEDISIFNIDTLFEKNELELLSKIVLDSVSVKPIN